jgi:hypothetical protein
MQDNPSAGHATGLPDPVPCDEACNATNLVLISMEGFVNDAWIFPDEHPALAGQQRQTAALHVLLYTLPNPSEALRNLRSAE